MNFKYLDFYDDHIAVGEPKKAEISVNCIFHEDESPSLSINLESGAWKCHTPDCEGHTGGNIYQFYMLANKDEALSYDTAREQVNEKYGLGPKKRTTKTKKDFPISADEIAQKHSVLLDKPKVLATLTDKLNWSLDTIKDFQIGFDGQRVWIPITENGQVVNIRKYSRKAKGGNKVISVANFGEARLWPLEAVEKDHVFVFEGEKDCLQAHSLGLNGITVTGGAGTFKLEWAPLFEGRKVFICYDIDQAGKKGADIVARYLMRTAAEVKVIHLPMKEPDNADFSDYIASGKTREDFLALVESTKPIEPLKDSRVPDVIVEMPIAKAVEKKLFYRRIKSKVRVVSKMETPSLLPGVLNFTCTRANGNMCNSCENKITGATTIILNEKSIVTLRLLASSVKESRPLYKEVFKVPARCSAYQVLETDHQYVEDILSSPIVDEYNRRNIFKQRFEEHQMFILNTALDVNTDYDIESVMYEHPVDRKIVHLVYKIEPCLSTLENSDLNEAALKALEGFQDEYRHNTEEVG